MPITDTSRLAYKDILADGTAKTQASNILYVVREHYNIHYKGLSLREISSLTNYDINAVSGRVNDLKKANLLETEDKRKCTITKRLISPVIPILTVEEVKQEDIEMEGRQLMEEFATT